MKDLKIKSAQECRWDLVALGEVMLRLEPGDGRIHTARQFTASEGGGEYNVARGLRRCFGLRTTVVTALADNPVGRLVEDLMLQGGVDQSHVRWMPYDGVGRKLRNGLNFTERGYGVRAALGCSDRGQTAISQLKPGDVDWRGIFGKEGARWFHTGGIYCALSDHAPQVALEAMKAAKEAGAVVSFDLNYRDSLWKALGGSAQGQEVNRKIAPLVDVMFGNEEDYSAALGFPVESEDKHLRKLDVAAYQAMMERLVQQFPNLSVVAVTLRNARTATVNDWSALCYHKDRCHPSVTREGLEIFDRVGGGDSFAAGLIYGLLDGKDAQFAVDCGAAHGALAMTTPGDTSMATLPEVLRVMQNVGARIAR